MNTCIKENILCEIYYKLVLGKERYGVHELSSSPSCVNYVNINSVEIELLYHESDMSVTRYTGSRIDLFTMA